MRGLVQLGLATLLAGSALVARAADIGIDDPYARAVPPGQPNSAVFMTLTNHGKAERALVGAESRAAATVELHTHVVEQGMMAMRRIERIALPAGQPVELQPGGLHVMLIGLRQPLEPGAEVALTLVYDDGSTASVLAPVRQIAPPRMSHGK